MNRPGLGGFAALALCTGTAVRASEPLRQAQQPVANFAFASQLGAGIYSVEGRSVQIYGLPFAWELRPPTTDRLGFNITLPLTLGFYSFRTEDVLTGSVPHSVDTYSLLPGLASRVTTRW